MYGGSRRVGLRRSSGGTPPEFRVRPDPVYTVESDETTWSNGRSRSSSLPGVS